ncbi:MAG: hypothetical protein UZ14_CFX002000814 [Chloroflexi bacterium OLB14]|nr:MAG: hypothetical protein UZ14_CFX002000814 [Chloroflexi bacterium OLB14]
MKKPIGLITRGKTATNRLRRVDNFILMYEPALLSSGKLGADSLFVDLGYGFDPRTTLESAMRFRKLNPNLKILGVEIDKERVAAAQPYADDKTFFRLGGFNLPLKENETVRLIRAFNVLRQYEEKDFMPAYNKLMDYVLPNGLMIEGTSNPFGSIWVANVVRRLESNSLLFETHKQTSETQNWRFESLVFSTNFRLGFEAQEFQTILPKNLIHQVVKGNIIYDFFQDWIQASKETSSTKTYGFKQWFIAAAEKLAHKGYKIDLHKKWLSKGWLIWYQ